MNSNIFYLIIVAFFSMFFAAGPAEACRRCGHSGSFCHFAHHAPVVHHDPPAQVTNFIFSSQFPGNYFPEQGGSVFGYSAGGYGPNGFSLQAQAQYVDPAMVVDRAARLAELTQANATAGINGFNDISSKAMALNDQLNQRASINATAAVAISAINANQSAAPQAQSLKVSVKSTGETVAEWLPAEDDKPVEFNLQGGADISLSCAKCHDMPAAEAPKGFHFDGKGMTQAESDWAQEQVWAGKMPPKSNLDRAGKAAVAKKLQSLVK